jgi:hypothetical protein
MADDFDEDGRPVSSLGERLVAGVRNLWDQVNALGKIQNHQGQEIEALRAEMNKLKFQVHGLKVSRGMAVAAKRRLETKLDDISDILH